MAIQYPTSASSSIDFNVAQICTNKRPRPSKSLRVHRDVSQKCKVFILPEPPTYSIRHRGHSPPFNSSRPLEAAAVSSDISTTSNVSILSPSAYDDFLDPNFPFQETDTHIMVLEAFHQGNKWHQNLVQYRRRSWTRRGEIL